MIQNWKLNVSIIFLFLGIFGIFIDLLITMFLDILFIYKIGYIIGLVIGTYFTAIIPLKLIFEYKKIQKED